MSFSFSINRARYSRDSMVATRHLPQVPEQDDLLVDLGERVDHVQDLLAELLELGRGLLEHRPEELTLGLQAFVGDLLEGGRPDPFLPKIIDAGGPDDRAEPALEAPRILEVLEIAEDLEEGVLGDVARHVDVADDVVGDGADQVGVLRHQLLEGLGLAAAGPEDQRSIVPRLGRPLTALSLTRHGDLTVPQRASAYLDGPARKNPAPYFHSPEGGGGAAGVFSVGVLRSSLVPSTGDGRHLPKLMGVPNLPAVSSLEGGRP